jgi:hypothetical protein
MKSGVAVNKQRKLVIVIVPGDTPTSIYAIKPHITNAIHGVNLTLDVLNSATRRFNRNDGVGACGLCNLLAEVDVFGAHGVLSFCVSLT